MYFKTFVLLSYLCEELDLITRIAMPHTFHFAVVLVSIHTKTIFLNLSFAIFRPQFTTVPIVLTW